MERREHIERRWHNHNGMQRKPAPAHARVSIYTEHPPQKVGPVRSPRRTSARSYSGQLVTRYLVLYVGWTFERLDIRNSVQEPLMYTTGVTKTGRRAIRAPTPCGASIAYRTQCQHQNPFLSHFLHPGVAAI
jgi:hypothetical protein